MIPPSTEPGAPSSYLELRHASTDHAIFVTVPTRRFIAIDGIGRPSSTEFLRGFERILAAHVALLADLRRRRLPVPLRRTVAECLWEPIHDLTGRDLPGAMDDLSEWRWRQLLEVPGAADDGLVTTAIAHAHGSRGRTLSRLVELTEGSVGQILHVGGRAGVGSSAARLDAAIREAGATSSWPLHELILADPREVPDARGRMILRLPLLAPRVVPLPAFVEEPSEPIHPWRGSDGPAADAEHHAPENDGAD